MRKHSICVFSMAEAADDDIEKACLAWVNTFGLLNVLVIDISFKNYIYLCGCGDIGLLNTESSAVD